VGFRRRGWSGYDPTPSLEEVDGWDMRASGSKRCPILAVVFLA
jgi:hypothetical protein